MNLVYRFMEGKEGGGNEEEKKQNRKQIVFVICVVNRNISFISYYLQLNIRVIIVLGLFYLFIDCDGSYVSLYYLIFLYYQCGKV